MDKEMFLFFYYFTRFRVFTLFEYSCFQLYMHWNILDLFLCFHIYLLFPVIHHYSNKFNMMILFRLPSARGYSFLHNRMHAILLRQLPYNYLSVFDTLFERLLSLVSSASDVRFKHFNVAKFRLQEQDCYLKKLIFYQKQKLYLPMKINI